MKRILLGMLLLTTGGLWAQDAAPTAVVTVVPTAEPLKKWAMATVPWDDWFRKKITVEDKTEYVYFFWDAQEWKGNFEGKDKKLRLAEAALQMAARLYPADAKEGQVKVDIVYYPERNEYGDPIDYDLQQVAHFEFLRSKILKLAKSKRDPSAGSLQKVFNQFVIY